MKKIIGHGSVTRIPTVKHIYLPDGEAVTGVGTVTPVSGQPDASPIVGVGAVRIISGQGSVNNGRS